MSDRVYYSNSNEFTLNERISKGKKLFSRLFFHSLLLLTQNILFYKKDKKNFYLNVQVDAWVQTYFF